MNVQTSQQPSAEYCQQDQCSDLDIFEMLSSTLVTIAKSEQILQCMRQVLVSDPTFTPMSLFKYLSKNSTQLLRKNLISFLDENCFVSNEKETDDVLRKVFVRYGINSSNGIQYTSYLNFIYPFNSGVLRELLTNRIKKYQELDRIQKNSRPSDSVITAFLLLLEEEIKVQKRVQAQVNDNRFPGKERLRKVIRSIKRASQKTVGGEKTDCSISMLELRNFIKAFVSAEDNIFLDLGRRLGLTKSGQISFQSLQNILKKVKKPFAANDQQGDSKENTEKASANQQRPRACSKQAKQISFKQQLYRQLANTLQLGSTVKVRSPRAKSASRYPDLNQHRNKTPNKKNPANLNQDATGLGSSFQELDEPKAKKEKQGKYTIGCKDNRPTQGELGGQRAHIQNVQNGGVQNNAISLFRQFIEVFLKGHKQIQKCKSKLASFGSIDYLSLFKTLDTGRGVVDAQSMQKFYIKLSGIPTDYDFQLLIDRFAQPEEKWLSYSEFSDIFRCGTSKIDQASPGNYQGAHQIDGIKLQPEAIRMLAQIIYLTLDLEYNLKKILRRFKKSEVEWLFGKINIDSDSKGFINYQELKRFLSQDLRLSIAMIDLMSLLKRLDRSKNGVVVKEQFLMY